MSYKCEKNITLPNLFLSFVQCEVKYFEECELKYHSPYVSFLCLVVRLAGDFRSFQSVVNSPPTSQTIKKLNRTAAKTIYRERVASAIRSADCSFPMRD